MYPITSQLGTGMNLEALLQFDPDLFANMALPEGIDRFMTISAIRRYHGMAPLFHPDPYWMKNEIYFWSRQNLSIWRKLYATTQLDYNPIWNTDMSERTVDTTTVARDTSTQNTSHTHGGAFDQNQQTDRKTGYNTEDGAYHEGNKTEGWATDDARNKQTSKHDGTQKEDGHYHEATAGTEDTKTEGTLHEETVGASNTVSDGKTHSDTTGTRLTVHDETMTDKINTTKDTTSHTENKLSAENEASYQPDNTSDTTTNEKGTSDETRNTNWTENENTTGTADGTTHEETNVHTTGQTDQHTTGTSEALRTSHTDGDTHSATTDHAADESHGESSAKNAHGDAGTTTGTTLKKNEYDDRGMASSSRENKHDEHAIGMETGKENVTTTFTHEYTKGGNIGVTTTQQMIDAERESVVFDIYRVIADSFRSTFCLDCY